MLLKNTHREKASVLILKQNFQENRVVTIKTPFFLIGPLLTPYSKCLDIGFWQGNFVWKCCIFNLSAFNLKKVLQLFEKGFRFPENMPISQTEGDFENP